MPAHTFGRFATIVMGGLFFLPAAAPSASEYPLAAVGFVNCSYGSVAAWPFGAGPRPQYAEAIVELTAYARVAHLAPPSLALISGGRLVGTRDVEFIDKVTNVEAPWDGVLPVGRTRLHIRVRLDTDADNFYDTCVLRLGGWTVRRHVDASWPTG